FVSNDIIDKFKSKVDLVANLMNLNSSLEFHMRLINIYCLPVLYHVLHADFDVYDIWEDVYKHICKVIGFRCRRVGLDRMFMSLNNGGYGLINLVDIDRSSKLSWINYVVDNIDNKFSDFISGWNEYTKKKANTVVGPLMSWNNMNGESNYLQNISRKWKKIRFYNNFVGKVASWNDNDGFNQYDYISKFDGRYDRAESRKVYMTTCNFVPADMTDINILRNYVYKIEWNC